MYTVDRIEDNIVILENRNNSKIIEINKKALPKTIKEGDIINIKDNKCLIDKENTNVVKKDIRNRFNKLK